MLMFVPEFAATTKLLHQTSEINSPPFSGLVSATCTLIHYETLNCSFSTYPDYTKEFILDTDTSDIVVDAVLSQIQNEGH